MSTDYKALCAELVVIEDAMSGGSVQLSSQGQALDGYAGLAAFRYIAAKARIALAQPEPAPTDEELYELWEQEGYEGDFQDCRRFYRGAIARWGRPTPQPPADGEVAELVAWLRATGKLLHPDYSKSRIPYMRAADLLECPTSQPVAVSERLPGPGEWVWHCYAGVRFWQHGRYNGRQFFIGDGPESQPATHWLPRWALPVPAIAAELEAQ
jgi:hypothetical protein